MCKYKNQYLIDICKTLIYSHAHISIIFLCPSLAHGRIQGAGAGVRTPPPHPLKNNIIYGFLRKTGPDPLKNNEATKPAFINVGHHRHASEPPLNSVSLAGRWWPSYIGIWNLSPPSTKKLKLTKKPCHSWTPSDKTFWIRA